jgi:hypothetical protein
VKEFEEMFKKFTRVSLVKLAGKEVRLLPPKPSQVRAVIVVTDEGRDDS